MYNESYDSIITKYSSMVYRIALSYTGTRHDAEDAMQNVFVRYFTKKPVFDSFEHEKAWFIRVTINCCKTFLLSFWRKKTVNLEDYENLPAKESEIDQSYSLLESLKELTPNQRLCVHLFYYEELSLKEIAKETNLLESTVKSHLFRAKDCLQKKFVCKKMWRELF